MTPKQNTPGSSPAYPPSKLPFAFSPRTKAGLLWLRFSKRVARWIAPWIETEKTDDPSP